MRASTGLAWLGALFWAAACFVLADSVWPVRRDAGVWKVIAAARGGSATAAAAVWLGRLGCRLSRWVPGRIREWLKTTSGSLRDTLSPDAWLALTVLSGAAGALWLAPLGRVAGGTPVDLAAALGRAVLGFCLASSCVLAWVRLRAGERRTRISQDLPGLVDLLLLGLEGGMSLTVALSRAAERLEGPLREEMEEVERQIGLGLSRREALEALAGRLNTREVTALVALLNQADCLGAGVTKAVGAIAKRLRTTRVLAAERRAGEAPIKMLFPLIFCLFPTILVLLVGPVLIGKGSLLGM